VPFTGATAATATARSAAGSTIEEGIDWSAVPGTSASNRCSAATLLLRGKARTRAGC
jgi:hypothetical protein